MITHSKKSYEKLGYQLSVSVEGWSVTHNGQELANNSKERLYGHWRQQKKDFQDNMSQAMQFVRNHLSNAIA